MSRQIEIVLTATVELADSDAYPEGMSLIDCAYMDCEADSAMFFLDQNALLDHDGTRGTSGGRTMSAPAELAAAYESARRLVSEALTLRMYGERPPGAPHDDAGAETWRRWDTEAETFLRANGRNREQPVRERRAIGWVCLAAFLLSIPFANWWLTQHGLVFVRGHAIPSAVWVVGFAFVVRDLAQLTLGKWWAWAAIAVGVLLSYWVADAAVATASAMAFLWSESTDALIFTPLANKGTRAFLIGVSISGYAASFVDSAIFMRLAFHSWDFVPLALAKILFVMLATPVAWGVRRLVVPRNIAVRTVSG